MRVIRRLDDPLIIKSFGFVEAGGLGEFDPAVYEEVELEALPEGYQIEANIPQAPLAQGSDLVKYLETAFTGAPLADRIALQAALLPIKATLESATMNPLSKEDFEGVLAFTAIQSFLPREQLDSLIDLARQWGETVTFQTTNQ